MRSAGLSGLGESTPKIFGLRLRSQSAALWSSPGYWVVYAGVPPKRSTAPVRSSRTSPSRRSTPAAARLVGGDVLARLDAGDV
jgi:hypothetical protein